ncbi:MAG TPA: hypothetical protein PK843_07760 [bacterium]|nr:hypothetical protein [bacterium]
MLQGKSAFGLDFWKEIIAKLTPKLLGGVIALAMVLLAAVLLLAVARGSDVSFWGVQISQPSVALKKEIESLQTRLQNAVPLVELNGVIDSTQSKTAALAEIRRLAAQSDEMEEWENKFSYKLLKLEFLISRYGSFISTTLPGADRKQAYALIQSVLAEVNFYQGEIDGDMKKTHESLVAFQNDYNSHMPEGSTIQALGNFGYQTLEAIRSRYRLISAG